MRSPKRRGFWPTWHHSCNQATRVSTGPVKVLYLAQRAWQLSGRQRRQALLAAALLGYANLALKFLPFSKAILLGSRSIRHRTNLEPRLVTDWVSAIKRASRAVPWRSVCIHEGLVLQRLLRRHGLPAILCYGTTQEDGELKSHVWVKVGNELVIGGDVADRFQLLAVYPNDHNC